VRFAVLADGDVLGCFPDDVAFEIFGSDSGDLGFTADSGSPMFEDVLVAADCSLAESLDRFVEDEAPAKCTPGQAFDNYDDEFAVCACPAFTG
jgi:hypothetical protein